MSLTRLRYLHKRRIIALIAILSLASTLFSITAYSFLGFYNGFSNYAGQEDDILAVYSKSGNTPFTGTVPLAAANQVASLNGVVAVSPETITPCIINNQSTFIRGVLPEELKKLNMLTLIEGENLHLNDSDAAVIGVNLAAKLQLKTGDSMLAFSVLSQKYVELQVKGVFVSQSALDDEAIVPLHVGQWLRCLTYNDVTLIRTKIDQTQTNIDIIYRSITNMTTPSATAAPSPTTTPQPQLETLIPITQTKINIQNIGVEEAQNFMNNYLNRYGISKDTLIVLSIVVLVFASGTAAGAISLFVKQHGVDIGIMRSIGVTKKKIKTDLILGMVILALIATVIGTAISAIAIYAFQKLGYLQVLSHSITFQLDPTIVAANFIVLSLLVAFSIFRWELEQ